MVVKGLRKTGGPKYRVHVPWKRMCLLLDRCVDVIESIQESTAGVIRERRQ